MHHFFLSAPPFFLSFFPVCVTHDLLVTVYVSLYVECVCVCMHVQISTWILFIEVLLTEQHHLRTIKLRATLTYISFLK